MSKIRSIIAIIGLFVVSLSSFAATILPPGVAGSPNPNVPGNVLTQDGYYTIRPDLRRCVFPICGGWFVNAVNRKVMQCPDGSIKQECYVSRETVNIPDLDDTQLQELKQAMRESRVLLQGGIDKSVDYGMLTINQAWLAATPQPPSGVFVNLINNGIVCITFPCPSYDALILNRKVIKSLASYDLTQVGASREQLGQAETAIHSDEGLPLAGRFVEVTGPAGTAQGIVASQFYLKLVGQKPKQCMPTGCSGQVCSDQPVITTCEWRPEYACYRTAICSQQSNGDCGWVMDEQLRRCLEDAANSSLLINPPQ